MLYGLKVHLLKIPKISRAVQRARARLGREAGNYSRLPELIRAHAPGRSFADIGCMWGVDGEYAFVAEEAGASPVTAVDVFGPTPEFERKREQRRSSVRFVLGDATRADTVERIGRADVVFCAGVLYHLPSPFDLLVALRRICARTLILRTSTIPEIPGLPNAAVYYPMLPAAARRRWSLRSLGVSRQEGITDPFRPEAGYSNWFWGLTPSCLVSMLETAGFRVDRILPEPFAQTVVCTAADAPFEHLLPDEREARRIGESVSRSGLARPA